jgi:hypothetical protein
VLGKFFFPGVEVYSIANTQELVSLSGVGG